MQGSQYLSGAALSASKGMMGRYMGYGNAARSLVAHQQRQDNIRRASGEDKMVPGPMFNKSAPNYLGLF